VKLNSGNFRLDERASFDYLVNLETLNVSAVHMSEHVALLEHVAALRCPAITHSRDLQSACSN
jgi:hypothetical protein